MVRENRLLAMLPADVYEYLAPSLTSVQLHAGQVLAEDGVAMQHAYFPTEAVSSIMIYADDGDSLEVGLIGPEGVIGTATFLSDCVAVGEIVVQRTGEALRIPATTLRESLTRSGAEVSPTALHAGLHHSGRAVVCLQ